MSDYAIVNLLELDDTVEGKIAGLEARFSRKHLGSRDIGVSHWRYAPATRNPVAHSHREQEEAYVASPDRAASFSTTTYATSASGT